MTNDQVNTLVVIALSVVLFPWFGLFLVWYMNKAIEIVEYIRGVING